MTRVKAKVWSKCLGDLHIPHHKEPRNRYSNSNNRQDITVIDVQFCALIYTALAHPWSSEVFPRSAHIDGTTALRQEERKKKIKYSSETRVGGASVKTISLIMEHFGRWGSDDLKYLQHLSKLSVDELGKPNPSEFLDHWRERFSIQLLKCNSNTIKKISSLPNEDDSFSKVDQLFAR